MTNANIEDEEGVVIHEHFDSTKEELWESITDPEEMSSWLGGSCTIEPRVGGAVRFELPEDDMTATGVVRQWSPPDSARAVAGFEHTFVDDSAPEALCVCGWWLIPSNGGCDLRFTLQAVDDTAAVTLAGPWARLGAVLAAPTVERQLTPTETAVELLRSARDIVLISWVTEDIPRSLVEAGFSVVVKSGPGDDAWDRMEVEDGELRATRVDPPERADLLHLDWTLGFHEYLELAHTTGVRTFWYHSGRTKPPAPADPSGCWLPARKSARLRAAVEELGLRYIDDHYIVDIVRQLPPATS